MALTWRATLAQYEKLQIHQKVHFMQKWHKYICICIYLAIQCHFCMKSSYFLRYLGLLILCHSHPLTVGHTNLIVPLSCNYANWYYLWFKSFYIFLEGKSLHLFRMENSPSFSALIDYSQTVKVRKVLLGWLRLQLASYIFSVYEKVFFVFFTLV